MRCITVKERTKRGCFYCDDVVKKMFWGKEISMCPHKECPYRELDDYKSFEEYCRENGGDINILKYFSALERYRK